MVIIKSKFPFPLLFSFLFTLLISSSYEIPAGQKTAVDRCIDRCRETEEELSGLFSCSARCERRYSEWEPESSPRELEQCQQRCLADERADRKQQQQCQKHCKEQQAIREREEELHREQRERDWEREREQFEDINSVPQDPEEEYKQCKQLCEKQEAGQKRQCERRCERHYKGGGRRDYVVDDEEEEDEGNNHHRDPKWQHEPCLKQCERRESGEQQQQQQCKSWCKKHRQKEQRRREKEGKFNPSSNWLGSEEEEENNPYYFHSQRFRYRLRSDSGHMRVLQRFSQKSHLLRGIDNYRLAILEANPSTLVVPHHSDAETILVLLKGKGVITLVSHERRESFNMEHGDVIRVPAGTTYYLSNQDNVDRLHVAKLLQPVNTPGQFREYYAAGGGFPESYYKVFSYDILERALNTPREQLHSLFEVQQRQQGTIKRASQEQLNALSQHASSRRRHGRGSTAPFNLLSRKPIYNNNFGRFFEATPKDYQQLQEIDAGVTYVEINQGGMMVPHYNFKATTIVLVVEGRGRFEMGCPHLSSRWSQESQREQQEEEEEEESSGELQKISANLSPGDVFIIPPGHPIALVASPNEKLLTVGFSLNAMNNQRNFLAGKINIMNQVEREAMEVAFNVPARLIERVFGNNPKESYFVAGSEEQQQRDEAGSGKSLPSILDIAGVF